MQFPLVFSAILDTRMCTSMVRHQISLIENLETLFDLFLFHFASLKPVGGSFEFLDILSRHFYTWIALASKLLAWWKAGLNPNFLANIFITRKSLPPIGLVYFMYGRGPMKETGSVFPNGFCMFEGHIPKCISAYLLPKVGQRDVSWLFCWSEGNKHTYKLFLWTLFRQVPQLPLLRTSRKK